MARRARKNGANGRGSALDELIRQSVQAALTTWLSGTAMKIGEEFVREVFADEAERARFRELVREQAATFLERLHQRH
jgi:hypothetical protein